MHEKRMIHSPKVYKSNSLLVALVLLLLSSGCFNQNVPLARQNLRLSVKTEISMTALSLKHEGGEYFIGVGNSEEYFFVMRIEGEQ